MFNYLKICCVRTSYLVLVYSPLLNFLKSPACNLPSSDARWQKKAMGKITHCLTEWRLQTTHNHGVHSHEQTKKKKRGWQGSKAGTLGPSLSVWAACPSLGQKDVLSETRRCLGSVARGHYQRWRRGWEGAVFRLMKNLHCLPTKGATTGPVAFMTFCLCVCESDHALI